MLRDGVAHESNVLIQDGKIKAIGDSELATPFDGVNAIDLSGCTLFPGFIDVHLHGAVGVDTMEGDAEGLSRISEFLARRGVTAWLPTLVPAPDADYEGAIVTIDQAMKSTSGARILGVHYEGPFVNSAQCGALRSQYFRKFSDQRALESLPTLSDPAAIHMMTMAPEIEGGIELVQELKHRGWIISIGHTRAEFAELDEALRAGTRHMTHFMNAMAPLHQRAPGPVGWGLLRDEVTCDVIADGIHLDPETLHLILKIKGVERLTLISDAIAAAGLADGEYKIWDQSIFVENNRTRNERGNIAGSVITVLDAVRTMQSLGVSEVGLARMASTNPAKLLGIDGDCGSIETGKRADMVALNQQGDVVLSMVNGSMITSLV